jgi:hypothetical protein
MTLRLRHLAFGGQNRLHVLNDQGRAIRDVNMFPVGRFLSLPPYPWLGAIEQREDLFLGYVSPRPKFIESG